MIKEIKKFESYLITSDGKVINKYSGKILKPKIDKYGYYSVCLFYNGKRYYKTIHRLVAENFLPRVDGKEVVNHKDLNKLNNNVENLEWCTIKENTQHWYTNDSKAKQQQLNASKLGADKTKQRIQVYKDNVYIATYDSQEETAKALNINQRTLYNTLKGKYNNRQGYTFFVVKGGGANAS